MATVSIQIEKGDSIAMVVSLASKVAKATQQTMSFRFNHLLVFVSPSQDPEAVVADYIQRVSLVDGD